MGRIRGDKQGKYDRAFKQKARQIVESSPSGRIGGICWNGEGTVRRKQPYLMGESYGGGLYAFPADKTTSRGSPVDADEIADECLDPETLEEIKRQKERKRELRKALRQTAKAMKEAEKVLEHYRIFVVPTPKKDWEIRAKQFGYSLEEIDIHFSDFGMLLLIPVIEVEEGKKLRLEGSQKDRNGETFWLPETRKEETSRVFGWVDWRPITVSQAKEFGVEME